MLRFRKRHRAAVTQNRLEALQIQSLLDDPRLRAVMGDTELTGPVAPVPLDWGRPGRVHRPRFGRRMLPKAA